MPLHGQVPVSVLRGAQRLPPPERRKTAFSCDCALHATVKNAIESLGVPHTEVELILVNGVSVGFSHPVRDGDRISVYPKFEALDVSPLLRSGNGRCARYGS